MAKAAKPRALWREFYEEAKGIGSPRLGQICIKCLEIRVNGRQSVFLRVALPRDPTESGKANLLRISI